MTFDTKNGTATTEADESMEEWDEIDLDMIDENRRNESKLQKAAGIH